MALTRKNVVDVVAANYFEEKHYNKESKYFGSEHKESPDSSLTALIKDLQINDTGGFFNRAGVDITSDQFKKEVFSAVAELERTQLRSTRKP